MTIATTSTTRTFNAAPQAGVPGQVAVTLAPYDPIIDAIVFSRGRFGVAVPGQATLVMPNWPEIARVAEDCR